MDERKLRTYASLAEVVAAFAVIISLCYAGYELRRSSTLSSREADGILFERVSQANRLLAASPEIAEIMVTAGRDAGALSEADRMRFLALQHDFFDSWEIGWDYHKDGILDDETWNEWDRWFSSEARRRPSFSWSDIRQHFTGPDFRDHVDGILVPTGR